MKTRDLIQEKLNELAKLDLDAPLTPQEEAEAQEIAKSLDPKLLDRALALIGQAAKGLARGILSFGSTTLTPMTLGGRAPAPGAPTDVHVSTSRGAEFVGSFNRSLEFQPCARSTRMEVSAAEDGVLAVLALPDDRATQDLARSCAAFSGVDVRELEKMLAERYGARGDRWDWKWLSSSAPASE